MSRSNERSGKDFLVYVARRGGEVFIFVYDREVVEDRRSRFYKVKVTKECDEEELKELMKQSISINFFGRKAVKKGIDEGYVHPEGVTSVDGVPCAISIKMVL